MMMSWSSLSSVWRARWRSASLVLLAPAHPPGDPAAIEAGVQALAEWAAEHAGSRLELGLSARWLLCAATPEAETVQQALEMAAHQWAHYLGLDEGDLRQAWVCLPIVTPAARLVCAVPRSLVDGMQEVASQHGVRLQAVLPWWAFGLQNQLRQAGPEALEIGETTEWAWLEPGWCTRVVARRAADRASNWALERIWMAPIEDTRTQEVRVVASLQDMAAGLTQGAALWQDAAVAPLLKGDVA